MSEFESEDYIRVSTILSPFSGMGSIPREVLDKAAQRGTLVHEAITGISSGFGEPEDFEHQGYLDSYKLWWKPEYKLINHNERLFCDKLKLTGEYDRLYENELGETVLVDFKTSAKEGKTWRLQGSAYRYLISLTGRKVDRIQFVQLSKEGFQPIVREYADNWPLFLKIFEVWKEFFHNIKEFPEDL